MGRPPTGYRTLKGKRCVGVTTVTKLYGDSGGLIHWAWNLGCEGIDYRQARDAAGSIGSHVHNVVDNRTHGSDPPPTPEEKDIDLPGDVTYQQALKMIADGVRAEEDWRAQSKLKIVMTETPLIHPTLDFGGTFDAIGTMDGSDDLVLLDWKTSTYLGTGMLYQLGAYVILLKEGIIVSDETGKPILDENDQPKTLGINVSAIHCVKFGKEGGDFHHHSWRLDTIADVVDGFRDLLTMYRRDARLKRRL